MHGANTKKINVNSRTLSDTVIVKICKLIGWQFKNVSS